MCVIRECGILAAMSSTYMHVYNSVLIRDAATVVAYNNAS